MQEPARAKEPPVETLPLEERIRRRAYELYVLQGNQSGSELDDWLQAEEEIRSGRGSHPRRVILRAEIPTGGDDMPRYKHRACVAAPMILHAEILGSLTFSNFPRLGWCLRLTRT